MDPDPDSLTEDTTPGGPGRPASPPPTAPTSSATATVGADPGSAGSETDAIGVPAVDAVGSVGPTDQPQGWRRLVSGPKGFWFGVVLAAVLSLGVLGGMLVKVPYIALLPGTARDTEPLIDVAGTDEFPSDGELLFTTVRVRQRPNLWEYLWLTTVDDDATVVAEETILGDRTADENRQFNLALMSNSKQLAVAVALEELGYEAIRTDGVVVQSLVADAPAEELLELGDTIVAIDGQPTLDVETLVEILGGMGPGDRIELSVEALGSDEAETVEIVLADNPDRPGAGFLGIQPASRPDYGGDVEFSVEIDSGSVGGPSAGLAFTLAILDQLTDGELTGGATVAVTGTIEPDGGVGAVGGVLQKTAAVRQLGVDAFIVPARLADEELEAVMARAGDDLQIIPVENLDQALEALAELGGDVDAIEGYAAANTTPLDG